MKVEGVPRHTIEPLPDRRAVQILDQTLLPHEIVWRIVETIDDAAEAIRVMKVRGAPLIGATAAFGLGFALGVDPSDAALAKAYDILLATRPTAVNLRWALDRVRARVAPLPPDERADAAWAEALQLCADDVATNAAIGRHGLTLFREILDAKTEKTLNILTHCNAGWLGCVDWGTAIAPIYLAHDAGLAVHVWVSETRPRNQGASLTAWELTQHGIPHTLVVDNEAGHLLQRGLVDLCIVGTDRVTANGDVANKIGTYLKALAARAHDVPFYVALPMSTIDWTISDGIRDIPIEQRSGREVTHLVGRGSDGQRSEVLLTPATTAARNDAFDVTPAALVTALITEHGPCRADAADLQRLAAEVRDKAPACAESV
ncbi:MAG: S-methyl-5-thioribose-1-phosphate isomerase [Chthoniobacteraceae bacterium]